MSAPSTDETIEAPDGRQIGYVARGPIDGVPALYLHGAPGCRLEQYVTLPDATLERFSLRVVSIDRPGYGNSSPLAGTRLERARDAITVADALGMDGFAVIGVSSGGTNALAVATSVPDRVRRVVLCCGQMPYDDEHAIARLQPGQAAALPFLREGRTPIVEKATEESRLGMLADPIAAFAQSTATLSAREKQWFAQPWVEEAFIADMKEAFRESADGYLDDALLSVKPFEFDPKALTCPVRAIHGSDDDWEPIANLRRVLGQLGDAQIFVIEGLNHFGSIMYPDLLASLCVGDPA